MSDGEDQKRRSVDAGEMVFAEGSDGDEMFVLLSGEIEIKKRVGSGQRLLKVINQPNEFFGEMALVDQSPRSASAVASEASELLVVNQAAFEHLITTNGQFALKIIKTLSERIRRSNLEITELIDTSPRDRFVLGMVDFAIKHGEQIYNKGFKINIEEMTSWCNASMGMPRKEIDAYLYRLIKTNDVPFASTAKKSQDHIVLSEEFVARHNRRGDTHPSDLQGSSSVP